MNRLTYKLDEPVKTKYLNYEYNRIKDHDIMRGNLGRITDDMIFNKLGQLEDIEEENGLDLITLFKALKDGFYIKYNDKIVHIFPDKHITINFWYKTINVFIPPKFFIDCKKGEDYLSETIDEEYWFKDNGVTWALTREELENE